MKRTRFRWAILLTVALAGMLVLPYWYERSVTAQLSCDLDKLHGKSGWVVNWRAADGQTDESIALYRTLYVRLLFPAFQDLSPWKGVAFTKTTTAANRPWHYAVCVVSSGRETTYFWSMRQLSWVVAWDNRTADLPAEKQLEYSTLLQNVERRAGLNWSITPPSISSAPHSASSSPPSI